MSRKDLMRGANWLGALDALDALDALFNWIEARP